MTDSVKLEGAHTRFLDFLKNKNRARATILAYGKDIDQLATYLRSLGKTAISEVIYDDLEAFLKKIKGEGYTTKSISRKINSIKTFYRFLKQENIVTEDPSADIAHPKYETKTPRILSRLEYRALRDCARDDSRIAAIIELFLQTGIRIGELANIKLTDIRENEIYIAPQEGHLARTVPLNKAGKTALQRYLAIRPKTDDPTLFVTKTGRPLLIRNIRTAIDRFFRIAGITDAKVNDLRHTFIVHHLMAGTPVNYISKLVGHKRLSTTEKYLELVKDKITPDVKLEEL